MELQENLMRAIGQYRVCVHCLCKLWYSFLIKTLNKKVQSVSAVLDMVVRTKCFLIYDVL